MQPGENKSGRIHVVHRDGSREPYNADKINRALERAARGVADPVGKVMQIATETGLALFDGITTEELDQSIIQASVQNIKEDPDFDIIATRLLLKTVYKRALGDYANDYELERFYREKFPQYIKMGVGEKLLEPRLLERFDLDSLARAIDPSRDELLRYIGLTVMMKRYMIKDRKQKHAETPQYFWMRVAMGLSVNEADPTAAAKLFYNKMSNLEYVPGGSTNVNAGTPHSTLSNCYLMEMHDDIDHIGKTVWDVMKLSKATGGIGLSVTKLRAEGSPIRSNNTFSSGPIPFMHTIDSTLRAVSRAGKKMGALCFYMENWHLNFPEFIDLRQNAGDEYRRTRTANTAVFISDEFMKRVKTGADWYLFDPLAVKDLSELYGAAFSKRYNEYAALAEQGQIKLFKKVKAREQFRAMLISLQTTSHPWLTWKDTINVRALNNNTGTIHLSNLCTEICLPQDRENVAVCNLTSINLARHLVGREIDWIRLERSVRLSVRQLDNLLDVNESPIKEAVHSDKMNRAVGLGLMGFTDVVEKLGVSYESEEAYELIDRVMEFISFMAIDESAKLAQERGSYPNFEGSLWSQGCVPYDTLARLEKERGDSLSVHRGTQLSLGSTPPLDWDGLREKVKRGMRNATLMAIAPTANIGLVAGTTPGLDPQFSQMFSRSTNAGKFLELNKNLVDELKKRELWEETRDEIISRYGDLSEIELIPDDVKQVYKTSFSISPHAFIEVASRAQKWIDQAISRNMYLETRDIDEMMGIYLAAWEKGLKTTYYLHMKPRHRAEQSTTRVNKSEAFGKAGFGGVSKKSTPAAAVAGRGFGAVSEIRHPERSEEAYSRPSAAEGSPSSAQPSRDPSTPDSLRSSSAQDDGTAVKKDLPSFIVPPAPAKIPNLFENQVMVSGKGFGGLPSLGVDLKSTPATPSDGFVSAPGNAREQGVESPAESTKGGQGNSTPNQNKGFGAAGAVGSSPSAPNTTPRSPQATQGPSSERRGDSSDVSPDACPIDPMERLKCDSCQ